MKKVKHGRPPPLVVVSWETNIAMVNATISAGRRLLYKNGYKNMILEIIPYSHSQLAQLFCGTTDRAHCSYWM